MQASHTMDELTKYLKEKHGFIDEIDTTTKEEGEGEEFQPNKQSKYRDINFGAESPNGGFITLCILTKTGWLIKDAENDDEDGSWDYTWKSIEKLARNIIDDYYNNASL